MRIRFVISLWFLFERACASVQCALSPYSGKRTILLEWSSCKSNRRTCTSAFFHELRVLNPLKAFKRKLYHFWYIICTFSETKNQQFHPNNNAIEKRKTNQANAYCQMTSMWYKFSWIEKKTLLLCAKFEKQTFTVFAIHLKHLQAQNDAKEKKNLKKYGKHTKCKHVNVSKHFFIQKTDFLWKEYKTQMENSQRSSSQRKGAVQRKLLVDNVEMNKQKR